MRRALVLAAGLIASTAAYGQGNLKASMEKLDAASAQFHSFQADFHKELLSGPPINDTTLQKGITYFMRVDGQPQLGIKIVGPGATTVQFRNGVVKHYTPGINCFESFSSSNQAKTDTYLALGFGASGKELQRSWDVTDLGIDTVDGIKVEKLDLVPKDASVKSNFKHVTLWMVLDRGYAVKQVFYAPSGDTTTTSYTNIRFNEKKVDTKSFDIPFSAKACGK